MSDLTAFKEFMLAIFAAWNTPVDLPFIGDTSFFKLTLIFTGFSWLIWLIGKLIYGGDGGDDA